MSLSLGATKLPLRHLSVRVPWHDAGWDGTVCRHPVGNASCLILKRVREQRNDTRELELAGQSWVDMDDADRPPCVVENAGFMLPREHSRTLRHAYVKSSPAHANLLPTPLRLRPYSTGATPFRWMLRENLSLHAEKYGIRIDQELEEQADRLAGFKSSWVQNGGNQRALLDTFFDSVVVNSSIVFLYAKRTPLAEDTRRVIVGVGRVDSIGPAQEFAADGANQLHTMVWERVVGHSIRPNFADGFLLPYHQLLELAAQDPSLDTSRFVAFSPDDHWDEFSYGAEHVGHDGAISALLNCAAALRECATVVTGDWDSPQRWIDARLNEIWRMRGPYPGLGSALTAFGFEHGNLIAFDIASIVKENEDPWITVEAAFDDPSLLKHGLERRISPTLVQTWKGLPDERKALLKLIARFDISAKQAARLYQPDLRHKAGIAASDADLLANPYLLYEEDRLNSEAVTVGAIDRGLFPDPVVANEHPLPEPSAVTDAAEWRRVRAFAVAALEAASENGDTLRLREQVIGWIRDLALSPPCPVSDDLVAAIDHQFAPTVARVTLEDGAIAYQLGRLSKMGSLIRKSIDRRLRGTRLSIAADWKGELAALLPPVDSLPLDQREMEERARAEKVAALEELAASRVSVLIGPAGTGKTTMLSVLCSHPVVRAGGVLLLAPTGKARVRLGQATGLPAKTVAEFLVKIDRYDGESGTYRLSAREPVAAGKTVVIDEASMLTEEQLAATLDGLKDVERLILVGDPRQLPPIGSGRPFVDIVARLRPDDIEGTFPRVAPGYTELTIRRRQVGDDRDDLLLAEWFSGTAPGPGSDEIWSRIEQGVESERIQLVPWSNDVDLHDTLIDTIVATLDLEGPDDEVGFGKSLGGQPWGNGVFFWARRGDNPGAAEGVEDWQILSPVRGRPYGTTDLNRVIQRRFRAGTLKFAEESWASKAKVPKPMGLEEIVYGDKVIQTSNQRRKKVYPTAGALEYVANGEIGSVVGQYKTKNATYKGRPWKLEVEFSSQAGYKYDYGSKDLGEEGQPRLELAYAVTIHKAQGSEFGTTFLILPRREHAYSRELLYTALTRQRDRVVILHQGELADLKKLADPQHSETARRLTNLFKLPTLVPFDDVFLEGNLIHRTRRGLAVRSKSEVIVADALTQAGLEFEYERRLIGGDGSVRYPDFTIEDAETGMRVYWEHLGMLADPDYQRRWRDKLTWYRAQGILPFSEGGGASGTLVTSQDSANGGIDSGEIAHIIEDVFGL